MELHLIWTRFYVCNYYLRDTQQLQAGHVSLGWKHN